MGLVEDLKRLWTMPFTTTDEALTAFRTTYADPVGQKKADESIFAPLGRAPPQTGYSCKSSTSRATAMGAKPSMMAPIWAPAVGLEERLTGGRGPRPLRQYFSASAKEADGSIPAPKGCESWTLAEFPLQNSGFAGDRGRAHDRRRWTPGKPRP